MAKTNSPRLASKTIETLTTQSFLFRGLDNDPLLRALDPSRLVSEKLYSNRPVYTAFRPNTWQEYLYVVVDGGPVIMHSTPLDRVMAMTYPGGCFGMRSLPIGVGTAARAFPSLVEAYKTTNVIKIPVQVVQDFYNQNETFRDRYTLLFELREKFQYHLLNCSTYPPQAVAAVLRALIFQERSLGAQPVGTKLEYVFDLPIDLIARACQLNHRTVEQVLKGLTKAGYLQTDKSGESASDLVRVVDPEGLKEVYGATRDKVSWWPLK
ncbi:Crp/Fnr family transcriptional regulator [Leptolyngbya sp. BL0902]|uniref:Crp/Fnr family transcriptional regulator n=1 Tax=Leptolyngbya sp. BL0902 TaxID=1115757 RepID=UPI0018E75CFD|nr:Crp/Fnr family transcriptional regulator [Leptolyngbya sp. BL0902]